ncbi:MAG: hypothetical protein EBY16_07125 [Gammaproteobacteria bacterium]|nr:hypothetical protein [Gammaproteobacteria bacterium]
MPTKKAILALFQPSSLLSITSRPFSGRKKHELCMNQWATSRLFYFFVPYEEIRQLKEENRRLKMEKEILKKAIACLS